MTPVAKIDPVGPGRSHMVGYFLYNEDFIKSRDIHLGDSVLVERVGDVILILLKFFRKTDLLMLIRFRFQSIAPVA
ncbi:MAG: hypothetical protein IPF93_15750 [Saprospiraceae bacterium]|nr:hypothetical protein [Saprospiraceae bacterium]